MKPGKRGRGPRDSAKKVGIARYRPEDWPRWLETVDDRDNWESDHAEWLQSVTAMAERLRQSGLEVIWVDLEPESFSQWCLARGIANDREARSRFAAEKIGNLPPLDKPA